MEVRHLHSQLDVQQGELGNDLLEAQRRVNDAHKKIQSLQVLSWRSGPSQLHLHFFAYLFLQE